MACYKVTVTVIDLGIGVQDTFIGGGQGRSWKYTFYTRLNPNELDPPTEGLSPKDAGLERALRKGMSDPLNIVMDPYVPMNRKKKTFAKNCKINVKKYASNGSWKVNFEEDPSNEDTYKRPTTPLSESPPWGNRTKERGEIDYRAEVDSVGDGSCDQDFTTQEIDDSGEDYQEGSTECECQFGDSGLADFSGGDFGGLSQSFNAQSTPTMKDFVDYIESLQSSCLSNGGVSFTLQFACLPKNIVLEPFSLPSGWSSFSDAQKINFLNSKVTLLQQALGNSYYQEISLKTNCLKSAGTIINGHIYKQ